MGCGTEIVPSLSITQIIEKVAHPLPDVRRRALESLAFKLQHELVPIPLLKEQTFLIALLTGIQAGEEVENSVYILKKIIDVDVSRRLLVRKL